jgi:hypothetical protein
MLGVRQIKYLSPAFANKIPVPGFPAFRLFLKRKGQYHLLGFRKHFHMVVYFFYMHQESNAGLCFPLWKD